MRKSKTMGATAEQNEVLNGPKPTGCLVAERRYSTTSTLSEVTAASSSINMEEFEAMKTNLREKDERLLKMERELMELRQALQRGAFVGNSDAIPNSYSHDEQNRRASISYTPTTKKYVGSVGYEVDRRASAGNASNLQRVDRVPIVVDKKEEYAPTTQTVPSSVSSNTPHSSQENVPGFYVDSEGVEYYLDEKGLEYYKDVDGEWYADFVPESQTTTEQETAGWFMDVDGTKYYLDERGIEYNPHPTDGQYYSNTGQRLDLKAIGTAKK